MTEYKYERQKADHAANLSKVIRTVREEYPKLDGFSKPFNPAEVSKKSEKYNGVSWHTAKRALEEIVEKGMSVNGQVQKLGETGGTHVYIRDDPSLSPPKLESVLLKPEHHDREHAIPFTGG